MHGLAVARDTYVAGLIKGVTSNVNLMGEREARSVAERAELTEEERKGVYPNYDEGAFRRGTGDDVFQIKQERTGNDMKITEALRNLILQLKTRANIQYRRPSAAIVLTKSIEKKSVVSKLTGTAMERV